MEIGVAAALIPSEKSTMMVLWPISSGDPTSCFSTDDGRVRVEVILVMIRLGNNHMLGVS